MKLIYGDTVLEAEDGKVNVSKLSAMIVGEGGEIANEITYRIDGIFRIVEQPENNDGKA